MKFLNQFSSLLQAFFNEKMIGDRASPHTRASYSYTFQLLLQYAERTLKKSVSKLTLEDFNYQFIRKFLNYLTQNRAMKPQSLNVRIAAIRSFFEYIQPHMPEYSETINKVLSIKNKRATARLVDYLDEKEIEALLQTPDQKTWIGCRDHCLLTLAIQTGLRLSEILSLRWRNVIFGEHPGINCIGKGRKERVVPLTKQSTKVLNNWLKRVDNLPTNVVFPTIKKNNQMSSAAVQNLVKKYAAIAAKSCPSLKEKNVTPHVLRHTAAMRLLHNKIGLHGIALYLGHESIKTTYRYLNASLELKEEIINSISELKTRTSRFHPKGEILVFLKSITELNKNEGA